MALTDQGKISIWGTAREALTLVWSLRSQHIVLAYIAVLPFTVMASLGWLDPVLQFKMGTTADQLPPGFVSALLLTLVWSWGWVGLCALFWFRLYLTGPANFLRMTPPQLLEMWGRLMGYLLLLVAGFTLIGLLVASLLTAITLLGAGSLSPMTSSLGSVVITALVFFFITLALRFMLTIIGISVDVRISLRQSWHIMKGHSVAAFLVLLLLALPAQIIAELATKAIVSLVEGAPFGNHAGPLSSASYLALLVLSPLSLAGTALQIAAASIIFTHLAPRPKAAAEPPHQVDVIV